MSDKIAVVKCDVTIESEISNAVNFTLQKFGVLHVAIASAGIAPLGMTLTSKTSLDMKLFE